MMADDCPHDLIRCRSCGGTTITAIEHFRGVGEFYNVTRSSDGRIVVDTADSWSESEPTGRITLRCDSCDHEWPTTRRFA